MADAAPTELLGLLDAPHPTTFAYVDGPGDEPQTVEESKQDAIAQRLREAGAPERDVDAIAAVLERRDGAPSPSTRYVLARDGSVVVDEVFTDARLGPELLGHGVLPPILPLMRHRQRDVRYLVVETAREGARLRLESASRIDAATVEVEGRTDGISHVRTGQLSQARIQRHSEDIWSKNQAEVADAVDRLVREHAPVFVVVAGDVRARQLLDGHLAPASRELTIEVDAHERAAGSDDAALDDAIAEAVESALADAVELTRERVARQDGVVRANGRDEVVEALQSARVDTLLLDARRSDTPGLVDALDAAPWVAVEGGEVAGDARVVASVPLDEGLARAALLTGARVLVEEEPPLPPDAPREDREPRKPLALLRWAEG